MLLLPIGSYHRDFIWLDRYYVWDVQLTRPTESCYWMCYRGSLQVQIPTYCTISLFALLKCWVYAGYGPQPNYPILDTFSMYHVYRLTKHKNNPKIFFTMKISSPNDLFQNWKTLPLFVCHMPVGLVVQSLYGWTCTKFSVKVLIMCRVWDKILNRLLPSFISARKPNGVLEPLKIILILISLDIILITSPGFFFSSYKTAT